MNFSQIDSGHPDRNSIAILGYGSWATALVKIFTEGGAHVDWYIEKKETAHYIQKHLHNQHYLPSLQFNPKSITPSTDLNAVVARNKWIVLAIPSAYLEDTLEKINVPLGEKMIVSGVKGILQKSTLPSGLFCTQYKGVSEEQFLVISGPSHAEEIALNRISFLTIGCKNLENATLLKELMTTPYLKLELSKDVLGIEYAGTLKNIFAMVSGIAKGLVYGDNFQSVLLSNSLREMNLFLEKINPSKRTINDTVYLGDLLVTAYSNYSRNTRFGELIGKGYTLEEVHREMKMVAEGYFASKIIFEMKKKLALNTPIIDALYSILYQNQSAEKVMLKLVQQLN